VLKSQVKIGNHYAIRHSGESKLSVIRIDRESRFGGWDATKLRTKRAIRIKSAAKLRFEVVKNNAGKWEVK
jgi:hypothetical protein